MKNDIFDLGDLGDVDGPGFESELSRDVHADGNFRPSYIPEFTTPEEFVDAKIEMLTGPFKMKLDRDDIIFLRQFKTEVQINNAVKSIINKYWR